jgi:hypothetical protein
MEGLGGQLEASEVLQVRRTRGKYITRACDHCKRKHLKYAFDLLIHSIVNFVARGAGTRWRRLAFPRPSFDFGGASLSTEQKFIYSIHSVDLNRQIRYPNFLFWSLLQPAIFIRPYLTK